MLANAGDLKELQRRVNILPGDRSVSETHLISNQKAKLQNRTTTSLSTGEKPTSSEEWLPEVFVATRLKNFPFRALTTVKYSDGALKGRICVPARSSSTRR